MLIRLFFTGSSFGFKFISDAQGRRGQGGPAYKEVDTSSEKPAGLFLIPVHQRDLSSPLGDAINTINLYDMAEYLF